MQHIQSIPVSQNALKNLQTLRILTYTSDFLAWPDGLNKALINPKTLQQ